MGIIKRTFLCCTACMLFLVLFTGFAFAENSTGYTTGVVLNLREMPTTTSNILDQLEKGTQVNIVGSENGWYKVSYNGMTGWVNSQYVSVVTAQESASAATQDGKATITGSVLNVRSSPSTESEILAKVYEGAKVYLIGQSGLWYKIMTPDGIQGWVVKEYVAASGALMSRGDEEELTAAEIEASKAAISGTSTGDKLVENALKYLGVKYVWGGNTPKGFDCSGFVKYVYAPFGVDLNRVACDQAVQGTKVSKANLQPGDLVFFDTNGNHSYINHVGMYIGNGNFVHASSSRSVYKVTISSLSSGFYSQNFMTARRYVK